MHRYLNIYIKSHIHKKIYKEPLQNTEDDLELNKKPLKLFFIAEKYYTDHIQCFGGFCGYLGKTGKN